MKQLLLTLMLVCVLWPVHVQAQDATQDGLKLQSITSGGIERNFFYLNPAINADAANKMPLLLSLHGGGKDDGDEYAARAGYTPMAREQGFIIVYPNGVNAQWNDGRGVTFRGIDDNAHVDDARFLADVIDYFIAHHNADPARVYIEGSSNGGMMTYRMLCEYSEKIAAAAAVIASIPENIYPSCAPKKPVPLLSMNATADPLVPFNGGELRLGKRKTAGRITSTEQSVAFWRNNNGCKDPVKTEELPDVVTSDDSTVEHRVYGGCTAGATVEQYIVHGGGHSRPGMKGVALERFLGKVNKDIVAGDVIWDFLKQYSQ